MLISDLEYYEIDSEVNQIKEVEGGRFAFLLASFNNITIGNFTAVTSTIDTITQQGNRAAGTPSVAGFSFAVQALASSQPFDLA